MVDIDPHVSATKTLLDGSGKTVYVSRAPSGAALPYIVLEPSQGVASRTSMQPSSDQRFCRFVTRYFGTGWEQVDALRTHARSSLLDVKPTVTGRTAETIMHETEFPMDRDEDLPTTVIFSGDSWTFATWPA